MMNNAKPQSGSRWTTLQSAKRYFLLLPLCAEGVNPIEHLRTRFRDIGFRNEVFGMRRWSHSRTLSGLIREMTHNVITENWFVDAFYSETSITRRITQIAGSADIIRKTDVTSRQAGRGTP